MARWLTRRLGFVAYTLLVVSLLVFGITQVLPADAAVTLLGENATPAALAAVRAKLGLNAPAALQYWRWLAAMAHGDLGTSMRTGQPVAPVLTVSAILVAHVSRMVRSETIDVLHSNYIRAARLKGLPPARIVLGHALRNALLPVVTIVALDVGYLLGGIIVVEEIFALPGIGRALIAAVQSRDLPTIQAGAMLMAATYAAVNLVADIGYVVLDRRIRLD